MPAELTPLDLLRQIVDNASPCTSACSRLVDESLIERAVELVEAGERLTPLERELLTALRRIAQVPCNCAPHGLPGDECESCIARATLQSIEAQERAASKPGGT